MRKMGEQPNIRGALLWGGLVCAASSIWGYVAAKQNIPFGITMAFTLVIASAAFFPPERFKLWRGVDRN